LAGSGHPPMRLRSGGASLPGPVAAEAAELGRPHPQVPSAYCNQPGSRGHSPLIARFSSFKEAGRCRGCGATQRNRRLHLPDRRCGWPLGAAAARSRGPQLCWPKNSAVVSSTQLQAGSCSHQARRALIFRATACSGRSGARSPGCRWSWANERVMQVVLFEQGHGAGLAGPDTSQTRAFSCW